MNTVRSLRICFILSILILVLTCRPAAAHSATKRPGTCPAKANSVAIPVTTIQNSATERDGQHDFDFNLGTWHTQIKRLVHPLTGSTTWVEMNGTVVVRKVWDGRGQLEEIEADGLRRPLRRFDPISLQSSISSMEPIFFQQRRRLDSPTRNR